MDSNRRSGIDRRKQTGINVRLLVGEGNRMLIKRQEDQGSIFLVDQYSPILFVAIIGILFLFAIDTISKLFLLNHGAYATNPIMAYLLNTGPYAFFTPKYAVTILATACLFMFRGVVIRKLNVGAHSFFYLAAWVYVTVVAWELYFGYDFI